MKVLSIIICVALLINALLFIPMDIGSAVDAGAGNGMNTKIVKPEAVGALMKSISMNADSVLLYPSSDPSVIDRDNTDIEITRTASEEKETKKAKPIESVTVREVSNMSVSSTYEYAGEYSSSKSLIKRDMTMYITKTAAYYHSVGHFNVSASSSTDSNAIVFDFDMEFYMDVEEEKVLVKINRWQMLGNETVNFSSEIMGKWIAFSSEGMGTIMSVMSMNNSAFDQMGDVVDQAVAENKFRQANKVYRLSKSDLSTLLGESDEITVSKADFTVDLSNSEKPVVSMLIGMNNNTDDYDVDYFQNISAYADVRYEFSNIDNTVVSIRDGVDVLEIDDEELEAYVIINE